MGDSFSSLADLVIAQDTLTYNGHTFVLRGLTYPHIVHIVRNHHLVLEELYLQATEGKMPIDPESVVLDVAAKSETLVAMVIACAMGHPEHADKAALLPFTVQIEALEKIITLTIANEGGVEKLVETVVRAVSAVAKLTSPKT